MRQRITTGEAFKTRRITAGLSIAELAERSGISIRAIADIEAGRVRRPQMATVRRIAEALDVAVTDLLVEELTTP